MEEESGSIEKSQIRPIFKADWAHEGSWHVNEILDFSTNKKRNEFREDLSKLCLEFNFQDESSRHLKGDRVARKYFFGEKPDRLFTKEDIHCYVTLENWAPNLNFGRWFYGGKLMRGKLGHPEIDINAHFNDKTYNELREFFGKFIYKIYPYIGRSIEESELSGLEGWI